VGRRREVGLAGTEADDRLTAAFSALALASTLRVADSAIAATRAEIRRASTLIADLLLSWTSVSWHARLRRATPGIAVRSPGAPPR
jgi:hypothetical protein